ncbi:MAG: alpha-L-fucosidase [Saprospiraceae bacterium]|nr:alpha-L-fucosidase [Saprospiraceae bacterium]
MKEILFVVVLLAIVQPGSSQVLYEADWKSLDSRPVAGWFEDAKFGIFIHWGPYSVPAWSPKGTYSEWYQYWLQNRTLFGNGQFKGTEVADYHEAKYGKDFPYYQFGNLFTAELFNPDDWASLFSEAGARYVVLTSKHHDGFTLWPSTQADDRGFAWNSMEVGAKRDLVGDLSESVKKAGLKMGLYYSLYEWFHPWWLDDKDRFVDEHFLPQVKDLVQRYEPDILWGDGEWEMESDKWRAPELIAWLYNESKVRDKIIINDRWGKGARHEHGGYFTSEYEAGLDITHPWEECRGMGFSFGYNSNEDITDYNSARTLILLLVDVVSRGGNLLLDIGPRADGKIPPIMQERLTQMGQWLKINGEAIYGTRRWIRPVQWSEGNRDCKPDDQHYLGGDFILKQTIDPAPGCAVKELFFTKKDEVLYAISPIWPGNQLRIKDLELKSHSAINLLGAESPLAWKQEGNDIIVEMPSFDPNRFNDEKTYGFSFKIRL